jgi:hypothetical protein
LAFGEPSNFKGKIHPLGRKSRKLFPFLFYYFAKSAFFAPALAIVGALPKAA